MKQWRIAPSDYPGNSWDMVLSIHPLSCGAVVKSGHKADARDYIDKFETSLAP